MAFPFVEISANTMSASTQQVVFTTVTQSLYGGGDGLPFPVYSTVMVENLQPFMGYGWHSRIIVGRGRLVGRNLFWQ